MATPPDFTAGGILTAAQMNAVGLWRVTNCTVTSVGGTAATASNGVVTIGNGNTSITVNNAFSADYTNYRLIFDNIDTTLTAGSLSISLGSSTGSTYSVGGIYGAFGTATANGYGPAASTKWTDVLPVSDTNGAGVIDVLQPQKTLPSYISMQGTRSGSTGSSWYIFNGIDTAAIASTSFVTTLSSAGSFVTGTIRVYGYRN